VTSAPRQGQPNVAARGAPAPRTNATKYRKPANDKDKDKGGR
jgi:hypothetical protein